MNIMPLSEIKKKLQKINLIEEIENAFVASSNGNVVSPLPGELIFNDPPGDVHIKYGYIKDSDYYVIKIASGFYQNPQHGLSSCQGMMLVFDKCTGQAHTLLQDEGFLTNVRTAVVGAIAAKYLAPKTIKAIGIVGTGIQAKLQSQKQF